MTDGALLADEVVYLKTQLQDKNAELTAAHDRLKAKTDYIARLEDLIKQFQRKQYGRSSEKVSVDQLGLFNEAETLEADEDTQDICEPVAEVKAYQRQTKPRVSIPATLPRETIVYDLSDAEKVCPHDGTVLTCIGSVDHEQLDIIPAQIKVLQHIRHKYACPRCQDYIVTASKPKQLIEKSIASPGLLAYVAIQKYADALPLYRQSAMFKRIGIQLSRSNLANWMLQCGERVQPLINLFQDNVLEQPFIHLDETPVQVLNEVDKPTTSTSYMWVIAGHVETPIRLFHYAPSRSQSVPLELLSPSVRAIMVDGYKGYQVACDQYQIIRLGCWAHARRKFVEAQQLQPKGKMGKADQALAFIQKLYCIEKTIQDKPADERYRIRQIQAKPIIDKIKIWLDKSLRHVPPKTALGDALYYLHRQWDRLIGYLKEGAYPIDNNYAENVIRPFVIGRKNWLFASSQAGAKASANLYSIIETAKANQLNPYEYLNHIFKELPNAKSLSDIEELLPWNCKTSCNSS